MDSQSPITGLLQEATDALVSGEINGKENISRLFKVDYGLDKDFSADLATYLIPQINKALFPAVTTLELFLTDGCVLDCDYCFLKKGDSHRHRNRMSSDTARQAVDFLLDFSREEKELSILFFGGEPLLEFPLIQQVVRYANEQARKLDKEILYSTTTNGLLLDEAILDFFARNQVKFLLSLDGKRSAHDRHRKLSSGKGSFDRIVEKLPLFKKYQPWQGARMTISPDIVGDVSAGFEDLLERGINHFIISPAEGSDWSKAAIKKYNSQLKDCVHIYHRRTERGDPIRLNLWEEISNNRFAEESGRWGCRAGRHSLTVDVDGDIYPCSKMLFPDGLKAASRLGSLDSGLENIGLRMKLCDLVHVERESCRTCSLENICTGGCYAVNYWENGDIFVPSAKESCAFTQGFHQLHESFAKEIKAAIQVG